MIEMTAEQVKNEEYKQYDPDRYNFLWLADGGVIITPCLWWDDASYARYQGDPEPG